MQPRGVYGASASKISLIEPMQASPRCGDEARRGSCARARAVVGVDACSQASTNGPISQRPDRALVVGGVARAQVAVVVRLVVGVAGRERAQADRRQQALARPRRAPAAQRVAVEHRVRQRDREELVRAGRRGRRRCSPSTTS